MQSAKLSPGAYELTFIKNGYVREDVEFTVSDKAVALENIAPVCGDIRGEAEAESGDGKVNMNDFIRVLRGFGENSSEHLRFSVDLNEDGVVNVNDLAIIKASMIYGK